MPLPQHGPHILWREPVHEHLVVIRAAPSERVEVHRGGHVLGDGGGIDGLDHHRLIDTRYFDGLDDVVK